MPFDLIVKSAGRNVRAFKNSIIRASIFGGHLAALRSPASSGLLRSLANRIKLFKMLVA
jgi:hypothetical protein